MITDTIEILEKLGLLKTTYVQDGLKSHIQFLWVKNKLDWKKWVKIYIKVVKNLYSEEKKVVKFLYKVVKNLYKSGQFIITIK